MGNYDGARAGLAMAREGILEERDRVTLKPPECVTEEDAEALRQ